MCRNSISGASQRSLDELTYSRSRTVSFAPASEFEDNAKQNAFMETTSANVPSLSLKAKLPRYWRALPRLVARQEGSHMTTPG